MKTKRLLSLFLVFAILFTLFPSPVPAEAATYTLKTSVNAGGIAHFGNYVTSTTVSNGTVVNFQTTPETGYVVDSISITGVTAPAIKNGGGDAVYQFTMPSQNVTVTVKFKCTYEAVVFDNDTDYSLVTAASSMHRATSTSRVTLADYTGNAKDACMQLNVSTASTDPYIYIKYDSKVPNLYVSNYKYIVITAKTSSSYTNGMIYPITSAGSSDYNANQNFGFGFTLINDGLWHDYVFDMNAFTGGGWSGILRAIRFDYINGEKSNVPAGTKFYVRSVQLLGSLTKPAISASNLNYGKTFSVSYSGLGSYINTRNSATPFVGIWADGKAPGQAAALQYKLVSSASGSVSFPITSSATGQGGTTLGNLAPGYYNVWLGYDSKGTTSATNFENAQFATVYADGPNAAVSLGNVVTKRIRIDPKVTITAPSSGTLVVKNSSGTTLSSGNFVQYGSNITIEATPPTGYRVNKITVSGGTSKTNGTTQGKITYTTSVKANVTISVSYTKIYKISYSQPTGGTITVTNNSSGATISNGAYVESGTVIKVTASAKTGYTFKSLTVAGSSFTSGNTKTISADTSISASFTVNQYTLSYTASPTGGTVTVKNSSGTTISSGTKVNYGTSLTVTATAKTGYSLSTLKYGSTSISSGGTFTMPAANTTVAATFTANKYKMTITNPTGATITVKDASGNAISSGTTVAYGTKLTVTLTPSSGYRVKTVTINGSNKKTYTTMSTTAVTYSYTVGAAAFTISGTAGKIYKVSYTASATGGKVAVTNNSTGDTISSGSYVDTGTVIKVTATPSTGYNLSTLKAGSTTISSGGTYTVSAATTVAATWAKKKYTVTISASNGTVTLKDASGNAITSGSSVEHGTVITVTATPATGYKLSTLKAGSTSLSSGGTFTLTAATTVTGTFTKQSYTMTITNPTGATITVKDASGNAVATGASVPYQSVLTVTLTPSSGYRVKNVTINGTSKQTYATMSTTAVTYTYTVGAAAFTVSGTAGKIYKVTITNPTGGTVTVKNGSTSVSSGSYVDTGTSLTITLTPSSGYRVKTITAAGTSIKDNSTISNAAVSATHTITAATTYSGTCGRIYKVTISNPSNGTVTVKNGSTSVTTGSYVDAGTSLTITLTPSSGYRVKTITAAGTSIKSNSTISSAAVSVTDAIDADTTYSGTVGRIYKVTITNPSNGTITVKNGSTTISSGGYVDSGASLTITLTPSSGYRVKTITAAGTSIKDNATVSNAAVSATDAIDADTTYSGTVGRIYKVTITNPSNGTITVKSGSTTISSGGYADADASLTITLTPSSGYRVKTITAAGTSIKSNSTVSNAAVSATDVIDADTTYSGTCGAIYKVTITNPSNGTVTVKNGSTSVTSGTYVDTGTSLTITLTPSAGYRVKTITAAGSSIKSNSTVSNAAVSVSHNITADTTYSGTVGAIYKVTISNPSGGKVTVKNGSTSVSTGAYVDAGTSLTITLTPNSGYRVKTITAAGSSIKSNSTISTVAVSVSHDITADTTYSGTCGKIYNVSVGVISNKGTVTLSKTGLADVDSAITITATPEPGYALNTLYVNGVAISGNTFKVTGAAVVTAKFISVFEVEVFAQTVGSAISSTSIKNTAGAVSNKFTQGTVSIATTEYNNILGKYGSTVTVSVTGITSGVRFLGWYDKKGNTYDRLLSDEETFILSAGLHTNMQIVAVFTATTETDTVFNFRNVYGQAVQTLVASKGSYVPVTEITATPFKSGSVFTGWEFLKNAYKSTAVKKTLDPDGDGTTSTYYLIDGTTQPAYKYDYSILYKESSCATPLFIYVNGAGGEVNIDGAYTKVAANKVVITVTGEGKVNNATSANVAYNTTVTATATGTGTFIGWIDKTNGTTRYSAEAFTTDNVTYYPYISYEKTFSFKALNAMTIQPVYGTSAGNKPNVSMNSVIQLQNNTAEKNNKYTAYGMFTATPGDGYEIVEWGTLFFVASDASTLPTTVITNASTGATETVNMLTLETVGPMQISRNIYEDNSNPSGQYASGIKVASARTIYVRMYCTYSYTDASTGELKYAVTYSDTYVFSTAAYSSSTTSGFVSNVTRYEEPNSSLDNSGVIELF